MSPASFIIYTQEFVTLTLTCDTDIYDMICDHVEKIAARSPDQPSLERTKNRYGLTALMLAAYEGVTHVQAVADTPTQATTRCSGIFCADQAIVCFTGAMAMSSVQETVVLPRHSHGCQNTSTPLIRLIHKHRKRATHTCCGRTPLIIVPMCARSS